MAGVVSYYNQVPRLRKLTTRKIIKPVAGSNPVDSSSIQLANTRGQLDVKIIASDDPLDIYSSFSIFGGFGDYPGDYTQQWHFVQGSELNCTVDIPVQNEFVVSTTVSSRGGTDREYIFVFRPVQSIGPTVEQISASLIGNNTLTIEMAKDAIIQGF